MSFQISEFPLTQSPAACYLKNSIGRAVTNERIFGARLLSRTPAVSSSCSASPAASTPTRASVPLSLSCPGDNGTTYIAPSGDSYVLECGLDRPGGDTRSVKVTSIEECIAACDGDLTCVDVSQSGAACYLKREAGPAVLAPEIVGARLLTATNPAPPPPPPSTTAVASSAGSSPAASSAASPTATSSSAYLSCPGSDGVTYTASNGRRFETECGIDHPGGDLSVVQMIGSPRTWLRQCIEACATASGCVDISLSGCEYPPSTIIFSTHII